MASSRSALTSIVLLLLAFNTAAFITNNQGTPFFRRTIDAETPTTLGVAEKEPNWTELPRVRETMQDLGSAEINTGRLAMIGFCGLLAKEIVSGQSFSEQIMSAVTGAHGVNLPI